MPIKSKRRLSFLFKFRIKDLLMFDIHCGGKAWYPWRAPKTAPDTRPLRAASPPSITTLVRASLNPTLNEKGNCAKQTSTLSIFPPEILDLEKLCSIFLPSRIVAIISVNLMAALMCFSSKCVELHILLIICKI